MRKVNCPKKIFGTRIRHLLINISLRHLALPHGHPVHGHLRYPVIVDQRPAQHEYVEYLMGMEPDVALAREPAFRHPQRVQQSAHYVEQAHEDQPAQRRLTHAVEPSLHDAVVDGGNDAAQSEGHEHGRPEQ